jgi:hypothetical protein
MSWKNLHQCSYKVTFVAEAKVSLHKIRNRWKVFVLYFVIDGVNAFKLQEEKNGKIDTHCN